MAGLLNFTVCCAKVKRYDHSRRHPAFRQALTPMSTCTRCGAIFSCAMADNIPGACWCTALPAAVPIPQEAAGCWCRNCLETHIADLSRAQAAALRPPQP
jgi:hypothetical protein